MTLIITESSDNESTKNYQCHDVKRLGDMVGLHCDSTSSWKRESARYEIVNVPARILAKCLLVAALARFRCLRYTVVGDPEIEEQNSRQRFFVCPWNQNLQ